MRLRYALVEHSAAAAADQIPQSVAQHSVFLECDQRFAVLLAKTDVLAPTVLAPLNGKSICHLDHSSCSILRQMRSVSSSSKEYRPSASSSLLSPQASLNPAVKLAREVSSRSRF